MYAHHECKNTHHHLPGGKYFYGILKCSRRFSVQVASLGILDLQQYLDHLEGQYFDFDTVIEDFWFIRSKISNFITLSGNKQEIKYPEDVCEIDSDLRADDSSVILRVSSTMDHAFITILVGLSLLSWSSAESILKVRQAVAFLTVEQSRIISYGC